MLAAHLFKRAGIIAGCYIDVNGLAALLLPALIAARERARRAVCSNNLDEIGKGVEMYLGQYGGYYPAGHNWLNDSKSSGGTTGYYGNSRQTCETFKHLIESGARAGEYDRIRVANTLTGGTETPEPYDNFGVIGAGRPKGMVTGDPSPISDLKMAPIGLGWLLYTGAMPDAKTYYCPSAVGKAFCVGKWDTQVPIPQGPRDWATAGGFTSKILTHGDWSVVAHWYQSTHPTYGVFSHYS